MEIYPELLATQECLPGILIANGENQKRQIKTFRNLSHINKIYSF